MTDWKRKIPTIMTSQELLDKAYARASKITVNGAVPFDTVKKTNIAKITAIGDMTIVTLLKYVRGFPKMEKEEDFFSQLVDVIIGQDKLKISLSNVSWCAEKCSELQRKYLLKVRRAPNIDSVAKSTKEFYGRVSSVVKRINEDLVFLQKARDSLKVLPTVDPDLETIVIAGYPNVGKSKLVEKISTANPTVASYPFTTKGIIIGHLTKGWRTYQIIDTPGLLDRELEERNSIELQAILALKYLADVIVFVIDPSESCGYSTEKQIALLNSVKNNFNGIPMIEVENKCDLQGNFTDRRKISGETGEGVDEMVDEIEKLFKAKRLENMDKLPE